MCTLALEVYNFRGETTYFAFYLVLWTDFSMCPSINHKRRLLDLCYTYHHIQYVSNHSTSFVVIFVVNFIFHHFWHIQKFTVNLDTMHMHSIPICSTQPLGTMIKTNLSLYYIKKLSRKFQLILSRVPQQTIPPRE
jgi:hypothetical protein